MPTLKNLNCSIELSNPDQTLREYGSFYGDGFVETFVAVPSDPKKFAVRLQSTTYIAEGLAMYVFIDGVYQCNRNRQALEDRVSKGKKPDRRSLVNFVVRQKEERQKDGEMVARSWNFEKLNIVSADEAPQKCLPNVTENIGCIEVLVLRCKGSRTSTPKYSMGFDGAYDKYNGSFSMDGKATEWGFDDRIWPQQIPGPNQRSWGPDRPASDHGAPSQPASVVERDRTGLRRSHSQHPAPSVITNSRLPAGSFRYGSGPLPETTEELFAHRTPSGITASDIVKPDFLKSIAKAAFREGQEAERRKTATQIPLQPPVDWPREPGHLQQAPPFYEAKESMGPVVHGPPPSVWTTAPAGAPHNNAWGPPPGIWPQGQSGLFGLGPPHVSDSSTFSSTYGTNATANLAVAPMKPKSTESQSGSSKSTSWPGDDEWVSVPPVSRSKNGSRSQKTHARETKSAAPSKWDEDLIDIRSDNSWGPAGEHGWASDSTITPPHGTAGHSRRRKSRSNRTPARSAVPTDAAWGPTPNALPADTAPAPSGVSTYASNTIATYSGREKKLYDELPPAPLSTNNLRHPNGRPISPPPPYGIAPAIFKLKVPRDVRSSGSRTASWESTRVDQSPLAWNDSKNSAAAPKSHKSHSKHESRSVSQTAKEKTSNSNEISGWGNPDATPTKPVSWNQSSNLHESGWRNGVSGDSTDIRGDGWGVQVTGADAQDKKADSGWDTDNQESPAAWSTGDSDKNDNAPSGWDADKQDGKAAWDTDNKDAKSATAWGPGTGNQDNTGAWDTGNKEAATGWDTANNDTTPAWNTNNMGAAAPAWDTDNKNATAPAWDTGNQDATPAWNTNNQNETPAPDACNIHPAPSDKKSTASQPHSRKSRLHSYHRGTTRRHWVFPPPPPSTSQLLNPIFEDPAALDVVTNGLAPKSKRIWSLPSEPIPTIPSDKESLAKKEGVEYAVRAGKGLKYTHAVNRPEYMDSLASPYAVFRFKYRTRDYLQDMFGKDVVPDEENEGRGIETASVVKQKLKGMSEQQMVEEILRLKGLDANGGKNDGDQVDKGKQASASAGNGNGNWNGNGNGDAKEAVWAADLDMKDEVGTFVKDWVGEQQARSKHSSKKGSEKAASAGGGGCGGDAWGGGDAGGDWKGEGDVAGGGGTW